MRMVCNFYIVQQITKMAENDPIQDSHMMKKFQWCSEMTDQEQWEPRFYQIIQTCSK